MPIPELEQNGWLPIGVHDCTMDEVKSTICSIPNRRRRLFLFRHLEEYLHLPLVRRCVGKLIIDGSFVSLKEEPGDIDIVVGLLPGQLESVSGELADEDFHREWRKVQGLDRIFNGKPLLHVFPYPVDELEYATMCAYFQRSDRQSEPDRKGVLQIRVQ